MNIISCLILSIAIIFSSCKPATVEDEHSPVTVQPASMSDQMNMEVPDALKDPIELLPEATGTFSRTVTTRSEEAQAFFDQGIQLKYAFAVNEAARSFREAYRRDSTCAMCYFGEAWSLGSYINGHMRAANSILALASARKAAELAGEYASPVEQELISALQIRYIEDYVYEERRTQDSLFALEMEKVYHKFPDDLEVATIYAEALFLLEPRRGTRDLNDPDVVRLHQVLLSVLDKDITHPGACHLYLHATESTEQPELGESCADYLGNSIPGASHINHMPSHTWNEVGRWGESVRANLQAVQTDLKARQGRAVAIYPSHNLHMLLYASSMDGQGAIAMRAGKDYTRETGNNMYEVMTLLRFGRFDEILEVVERPEEGIARGWWDFCQGYARLRTGETDFAKLYLQRVLDAAENSDASYRFHPASQLLGVPGNLLSGEIARQEGKLNEAEKAFRKAVELEDAMTYDEPEPFPFAARHWLGAFLIEQGRYAEAEKIYREELEDHPHNGWSLYGLSRAIRAQGRTDEAVEEDLAQSWARSDTWIESSRF